MTPADLRNITWEQIQERLVSNRLDVWQALHEAGPQTTRELARRMEWDILNVRPRVTELVDLFLAELYGRSKSEGIYRALTLEQARASWERHRAARPEQVLLKL